MHNRKVNNSQKIRTNEKVQDYQFQDHDDILCDGCGCMFPEELYIQHWESCIVLKRQNDREKKQQRSDESCKYCKQSYPSFHIKEHYRVCQRRTKEQSTGNTNMNNSQNSRDNQRPRRSQEGSSENRNRNSISQSLNTLRMLQAFSQGQNRSQEELIAMLRKIEGENQQNHIRQSSESIQRPIEYDNSDLLQQYFKVFRRKVFLTEPQFQALQRVSLQQSNEEKCSICMDILEIEDIAIKLECGHLFHEDCLRVWFKKSASCPNCNRQLKTK